MARLTDAKCRKCRRAKDKLFLKGDRCFTPKCAIIRKPYAPGVHGKKTSRGLSEYGTQLAVKQKIKRLYGVMERQFRKHFDDIKHKPGLVGDNFISRLERRLDNTVYRAGLAASRMQARQIVNHGLIAVNGKKVTIPSFEVRIGDEISANATKKNNNYFVNLEQALKNKKDFPAWINFDPKTMAAKITADPKREDVGINLDTQLVVEYYSR